MTQLTRQNGALESVDPRTGEVVGTCVDMTTDQVERVIAAARASAGDWGHESVRTRARHLREIRRHWVSNAADLSRLVAAETGKSLIDAAYEVLAVSMHMDWCSWNAQRALRSQRVSTFPAVLKRARVEYSAYGVVAVIAPWNYPAGIPMQVLPWVLAAGNAAVLKPSELTPMTGLKVAEIINGAGRELIHVATGGATAGRAVAASTGVDKIVFTGSGPTARKVLAGAATNLTPAVLELGGKDSMIVTDGADVDAAARTAVGAAFFNAGQTCVASERIIATPDVYDDLVVAITQEVAQLRVGDHPDSHVGPMTMPGSLGRVRSRIEQAVEHGALIVAGGDSPSGLEGEYLSPTVLVDVPADAAVVTEENFAPVMCIIRARDVDHAVELSNSVELGLSGSVFAADTAESRSIASRLETGGVVVGDALVGAALPGVPFGGVKKSGYGRIQGVEGFREFSRSRAVVEPRVDVSLIATMALPRPDPDRIFRAAAATLGGGGLRRRIRTLRGR